MEMASAAIAPSKTKVPKESICFSENAISQEPFSRTPISVNWKAEPAVSSSGGKSQSERSMKVGRRIFCNREIPAVSMIYFLNPS